MRDHVSLTGAADGLRDLDRLAHVVRRGAAPEAAAHVERVHLDLVGLEARHALRDLERRCLPLRRRPHVAAVRANVRRAVERLHRRVREERDLVHRVDLLRGARERRVRVADLPRLRARLGDEIGEHLRQLIARERRVRSFVPHDVERLAALHRGPRVVGDDRDAARDPDDVPDAGNRLRPGVVHARHRAAHDGTARDDGVEHAGQTDVDPERRGAVDLGRRVETLRGRADETKVAGVLQRRRGGHRQLRRVLGERAVTQARVRRGVDDRAAIGAARRGVNAPARSRRLHEHLSRRRARLPKRRPRRADALAAEDPLRSAKRAVDAWKLGADLRPVALEFFGQQHRQGRDRALPHLGLVNEERHDVVGPDVDPRVECEGRRGRRWRPPPRASAGQNRAAARPSLRRRASGTRDD